MNIPIEKLYQPFSHESIKQRKGNFGQIIDYVELDNVLNRLNEVLEGQWSFRILDFRILENEVLVHGELTIGDVVKHQFGGTSITRKTNDNSIISISDDLKASASDSLKKCASMFGLGLYLHGNGNANGKLTSKQITDLFTTCKANGHSQAKVIQTAKDRFQKTISQLNSAQAQELIKLIK